MKRHVSYALATVSALALQTAVAAAQEVEEIVVTAQKREERLQDVPVAVSAITANQLELSGIGNSRDLTFVTPGLIITQQSIVAQPQIRGVGARATGPGDEGSVPVYIDGIYQSAQTNALFEFNNIERVEVLKGPQGTLFGRNAQGGAVNIITSTPTQEFDFKAGASYARFAERKGDLYIAGGLLPNLAASLAVHASADGGFVKDIARDITIGRADTTNIRTKFVWTPSDRAEVTLVGFYSQLNDQSFQTNHPVNGNTTARIGRPDLVLASGRNEAALTFTPYFRTHTDGGSVTAVYDFDTFSLTALGSFQETEVHTLFDLDVATPDTSKVAWKAVDTAYTAEVRAASNTDGPFHWITGLFYFESDSGYRPQITNGNSLLANYADTKAYAVFAEGTYEFLERWAVTAGLRYSNEERQNVTYVGTVSGGGLNFDDPRQGAAEWDDISPRVTLKYTLSPDSHVYATYSKGFKSGIFNASTSTGPVGPGLDPKVLVPVRPETLHSYEVGLKTKPRANLRFNAAAYYYDYKDLQLSTRASGISTLQNASDSTIMGAEAELAWAVTNRWNVNLGAAVTKSEFVDWKTAVVYFPNTTIPPASQCEFGTGPLTGGNRAPQCDVSGNQLPKTPDWTVTMSTNYRLPIGDHAVIFAGNLYLSDNFYSSPQNTNGVDQYEVLNASVRWELPGDQWAFTLFGTNLTNNDRAQYISESTTAHHQGEVRPWVVGVKFDYSLR